MPHARRLLLVLAGLVCALAWADPSHLAKPVAGKLNVYFFDVGQGDAALIVSPTGKTVLVDGGPPDATRSLSQKIAALTDGPLDLVVLSHPHLDHLGGLPQVLRERGAKRYLDPGFDATTTSYKQLLNLVADEEIPYLEPLPGQDGAPFSLGVGGGAAISVIWPRAPDEAFLRGTRSDANSNSVVFRLAYGRTAFLFTGDAEKDTEDKVSSSKQQITATVLKVAHHGSRHSTQSRFLSKVSPKVAVISCAAGNEYGHPGEATLERLSDVEARVVRTDLSGDVHVVSDGETVSVETLSRAGERTKVGVFEGQEPGEPSTPVADVPQLPAPRPIVAPAPVVAPAVAVAPAVTVTDSPPSPEVRAAPLAALSGYAASSRSEVFHRSDCRAVGKILPKNLQRYPDRESAAKDRRPAGDCHP